MTIRFDRHADGGVVRRQEVPAAGQNARAAAFIDPDLLEGRMWKKYDDRVRSTDLSRARVLLVGFDGPALQATRALVRDAGVASCAVTHDVSQLRGVVGMTGAFTHLVVNFDAFASTRDAVSALVTFRLQEKGMAVVLVSTDVAGDDLGPERNHLCDATLRAPLSLWRLRDGLIAASLNRWDGAGDLSSL
jgi:hypothetical protein